MSNIIKDKIIIPSWDIIKEDNKIKKFYFFPWLLSIIFLTFLLVYQFIYTWVVLFWKKEEALVVVLKFFHSNYLIETVIAFIIFLIIYFILTPIFEWGLIKYIDNRNKDIKMSCSEVFSLWLYKFLPVFEYNNIFSEFKFISILNFYLFTLRFLWIEYIDKISYWYLIIFVFSTILNVLFVYSKYEIVVGNKWIFESIWLSSKIALLNIKNTIKLYFLMLVLNIRVIFNFLIFLSFPIIMAVAVLLITSKIFLILAIWILSILFIFFIAILWYLTAVLEIFTTSIWYYAYKEWKENIEKLKEM